MAGTVASQNDTGTLKEIMLKEVVIQQGPLTANRQLFTPDKDVLKETDDILNYMSGVSIIKRGNYAWEPGIRGLSAGQISTTIDGMAIFGACTDRMDPVSSYIEPVNLKSIAINYGNNTGGPGNSIGGGFDFKLNQPAFSEKKRFSGLVSSGYGTNGNAGKILTTLNYSSGRVGINVNGIFRRSGNYQAGNGQKINFSQYSKWNTGLGFKYKINEHQSLWFNYILDEGYNIGYPALTMDVLYARANILSLTHQIHTGYSLFNRIESKIYFNRIDHAMDDTKRPAEEVYMHMDMPGTSQTAGFSSIASGRIKSHQIRTGLQVYENRLHAEMTMFPDHGLPMFMLTLPDGRRRYGELSMSSEWEASNRLTFQAGFTAGIASSSLFTGDGKQALTALFSGQPERTDIIPSAFINPVYRLAPKVSGFLSGGYSSRVASLQELYGFYLFNRADNYDYLGNPALKQESSLNLAAGLNIKTNKFKSTIRTFSYFMTNYIAGIVQESFDIMAHSADGVKQYQNLKHAYLTGWEADAEWKINKWLGWESNNSFSYGTDHHGRALPLIPPFKTINRIIINPGKIKIQPEIAVRASQKHIHSFYGESSTPSSCILNLYLDKTFVSDKGRWLVKVAGENILDAPYYDHNDIMKILRPGRSFRFEVSYFF